MSEKCPYCGTALTSSLKFCISCRRCVTEDKINQYGTGTGFDDQVGLKAFKLSKREYGIHRAMRGFFFSLTSIMLLFLVFYFSMKYIVRQPIPGEDKLTAFVRQMMGSSPSSR